MRNLPNMTEAGLGRAIAALGGDSFETHLNQWLARCFEIDNTSMIAYFQDRPPQTLFTRAEEKRVHAHLESSYIQGGAYLLDPFHALHVDRAPAGLYRLQDIAPDQFRRNEYFAVYYQRTTLIDELAYVASPAEGVSVHVCLGRDETSGRRFSTRDMEAASRIAPIVTALIEQHWSALSSSGDFSEKALSTRLIAELKAQEGIALSPRQAEIAMMILQGHSSVSIGLRLGISPQTVKVIRKQLYRKCAISSQAELFSLMMPLFSALT